MKNKKLTTRIIAGKYKNKAIELPSLEVTRSSKSILKESFFNTIQFDIIDTVFVEAFGGSGSVGLEAISRGAKEAYFIEIDKASYRILNANCENIEPESCHTMLADTFVQLPNVVKNVQEKFAGSNEIIVYIDPPFDYRDGMEDVYEKSFELVRDFSKDDIFVIVFEHFSSIEMPESLGEFALQKTKKFGKSSLSYYKVS